MTTERVTESTDVITLGLRIVAEAEKLVRFTPDCSAKLGMKIDGQAFEIVIRKAAP